MPETMQATLNLIRLAQDGQQEALGKLFERYYSPVRAYVRRRLGPKLRLDADSVDIMQETFLCAVENFDRFEVQDDANLINWLSQIAENRIRSLARKAGAEKRDRRREQALQQLRESITRGEIRIEPEAKITLPADAVERKEKRERLSEALDELEPELREVILHRNYAKATWPEVAKLMGKGSESAARQLYDKAMAQLALLMGRE